MLRLSTCNSTWKSSLFRPICYQNSRKKLSKRGVVRFLKAKKIKLKAIRAKETYLGSVGSDVCRLVYEGGSVIGIAENRDQRAFCVFKDNSLIEINSLTEYLKDKKLISEE